MLEIIKTEDGSNTIYDNNLNEYYHSKFGAIAESMHVFIKAGLHFIIKKEFQSINIFEVGFGTGLNAFLTYLKTSTRNISVFYHTIEPFPLQDSILEQLNYTQITHGKHDKNIFDKLHKCEWNREIKVSDNFQFFKQQIKLEEMDFPTKKFDLIYFDAFAPDVQPELWKPDIFAKIFKSLKSGGILTTYSAKGEVRRNLHHAGFKVEKVPGPKGKREILRAVRISV